MQQSLKTGLGNQLPEFSLLHLYNYFRKMQKKLMLKQVLMLKSKHHRILNIRYLHSQLQTTLNIKRHLSPTTASTLVILTNNGKSKSVKWTTIKTNYASIISLKMTKKSKAIKTKTKYMILNIGRPGMLEKLNFNMNQIQHRPMLK